MKPPVLLLLIFLFSPSLFAASDELLKLRIQTKSLIERRSCFECHSPNGNRPNEAAMKVYNLSRANWYDSMSERQLREFARRLLTKLSLSEEKEFGVDAAKEKPLSARERKAITSFVDAELANRASNPIERAIGY